MKRSASALCAGTVAVAMIAAFTVATTTDAEAGVYPTNKCVSGKQKAASKYCQSALKAWSKYAKAPSKDSGGTNRDAAIAKAADKLTDTWAKEEARSTKKGVDCSLATVDSAAAVALLAGGIGGISDTVNNGVDNNDSDDRKCRAGLFSAAAKFCGGILKVESKFIKAPVKDTDRSRKAASLVKAQDKFTVAFGKAEPKCVAGQPDVVSAQAALEGLVEGVRLSTVIAPDAPFVFTHVVEGTPGSGEESWGETTVQYEKLLLKPRCVKDTPYSFHYKKGTVNKLLMYYQGGGACWSTGTCYIANTMKAETGAGDNPDIAGTGYASQHIDNQFKDWHVVFVSYCSGDVHWGNRTTTYPNGGLTFHRGFQHARLAEKWARERFVDPEEVFSTGSSAGSYGAIMNSINLMEVVYPSVTHNVLGDAGTGVITQEWLDNSIAEWGVDSVLPKVLGVDSAVELSSPEMWIRIAEAFPQHRFAQYQSAYDGSGGGQSAFYNVMKFPNINDIAEWGNWWQNTCEWSACMRDFVSDISAANSATDNFRSYTGAGSRHTVWGSDKIFTDTTDGVPTLDSWVDAMIAGDPSWIDVDCSDGGDCDLVNTCQGGSNPGGTCTSDVECPDSGSCQFDPDGGAGNDPYNNDGTVVCPIETVCPCGVGEVVCAP
ncbi:MAG: hypothetical protein ACI8TX_000780 [Hyphomicrobiaceae bacterium]|jgi:hypothetical protein